MELAAISREDKNGLGVGVRWVEKKSKKDGRRAEMKDLAAIDMALVVG